MKASLPHRGGSKIESTKRTVIMPKNLPVLAINVLSINVRVSLYRYVFLQRKVFYYKRTCQVISSLESRPIKIKYDILIGLVSRLGYIWNT